MTPAGYMLKQVVPRPDWLGAAEVLDLYSVSGCFSTSLADGLNAWDLNGLGLADTPGRLAELAAEHGVITRGMTLFYYEIFEQEYDEDSGSWCGFASETAPEPPANAQLEGFDVATYSVAFEAECSPLSCNSLANEVTVNEHCLFSSFEDAKSALEARRFDASEPGPFRILAVYTVPTTAASDA